MCPRFLSVIVFELLLFLVQWTRSRFHRWSGINEGDLIAFIEIYCSVKHRAIHEIQLTAHRNEWQTRRHFDKDKQVNCDFLEEYQFLASRAFRCAHSASHRDAHFLSFRFYFIPGDNDNEISDTIHSLCMRRKVAICGERMIIIIFRFYGKSLAPSLWYYFSLASFAAKTPTTTQGERVCQVCLNRFWTEMEKVWSTLAKSHWKDLLRSCDGGSELPYH